MSNLLGTPWHFENEYPSPNGQKSLTYGCVVEIAMGAPLSGECSLQSNGEKLLLKGRFGGPVVWSENSEKAALPYWTPNDFQKLAIIDTIQMKIFLSQKQFRVLQLSEIKKGVVLGIDSPINQTQKIEFHIETEEYASELEIKIP